MIVEWLRDFLTVIETGNFSRAAEARHITQPALTRRIQALEEWVGATLLVRTSQKVVVSPAGENFRLTSEEVLRRLEVGRLEAREQELGVADKLSFAATNALALNFFSAWLRELEGARLFVANIELVANHMEACERIVLQGDAQFLLGHHYPGVETQLTPKQFISRKVGQDVLIPVMAPRVAGSDTAMNCLPGTQDAPVPYLSYRPESGVGRIVAAVRSQSSRTAHLKPTYHSHLATFLVQMALDGRGMAWLPETLIGDYLRKGQLIRAGDESWDIPIEIHLFRTRDRLTAAAERFWESIASPS